MQTIKSKIRRGFSESAKRYDLLSGLHREIADRLLAQVIKEPLPDALLDVGCGTGYLTVAIKKYFSNSRIIGLDFAQGMIDVARSKNNDMEWVLADCHQLPFSDSIFDIVISNLAFQWAEDLVEAFGEAGRVLVPNGILTCTLFGYNTCQELFQSLEEAKRAPLQLTRLPNEVQVREALRMSGFKNPNIHTEHLKIEFKDMPELMGWLKSIGANNLSRQGYLGCETISKAASIYHAKFGVSHGVVATFEVIYAKK